MNVVAIHDGRPPLDDIPGRLRALADAIEAGRHGDVYGVLVAIPRPGDYPVTLGYGHVEGENCPLVQFELAKLWHALNLTSRSTP